MVSGELENSLGDAPRQFETSSSKTIRVNQRYRLPAQAQVFRLQPRPSPSGRSPPDNIFEDTELAFLGQDLWVSVAEVTQERGPGVSAGFCVPVVGFFRTANDSPAVKVARNAK